MEKPPLGGFFVCRQLKAKPDSLPDVLAVLTLKFRTPAECGLAFSPAARKSQRRQTLQAHRNALTTF
jgi:hypothetical protein